MSNDGSALSGPDLTLGVPLSALPDGSMLLGHARGEALLLVQRQGQLFAIGAFCTHYGAPLGEGLLVDDTIRCPWHHACFDLHTGSVLRTPARDPLPCWRVEVVHDIAYVREKLDDAPTPALTNVTGIPASIVIIGGGVAGNAAAETLRREGHAGQITMLSADEDLPCDRPNLSKAYLAGTAPEDWVPLRSAEFYKEQKIDVHLNVQVAAIDVAGRQVILADGNRHAYDALLLATGATPRRLDIPGAEHSHVHYLRTFADARALVAEALTAKQAIIIGSGFIGLEVAASLRARNIDVHVVGRDIIPMERILGPEVGKFLRATHEAHGVTFHPGTTVTSINKGSVTLENGQRIAADLVVIGIGVEPNVTLAQTAGLAVDHGVTVNKYLATSASNIFAAGDIARWPDPLTGEPIRIEHFVVAERQGETAARNILGQQEEFEAIPFFWTEQYDLSLAYVGHGAGWNEIDIDGDLEARDCSITYRRDGRKLAAAFIRRDLDGLHAELEFEQAVARQSGEAARAVPQTMAGPIAG